MRAWEVPISRRRSLALIDEEYTDIEDGEAKKMKCDFLNPTAQAVFEQPRLDQ